MRARIYARISDDTEGRQLGVQRQISACEELTARLGWTIGGDPIVDNDIGASTRSKKKRPGYAELMTLAEAGECDGVLFYSNSRLTRRPLEYESVIQLVERTGLQLATVASGIVNLTTADGRMLARILSAADAAEAERIGERVTAAFVQRREVLKLPNPCNRCYGYLVGGEHVNEDEADAIRFGAAMVLDGASLRQVGKAWQQKGWMPLRAEQWHGVTVQRALTNPRVASLISHKGQIIGESTVPAILDRATWDSVRDTLGERRLTFQKGAYTGTPKHLLTGFMTCGRCGRNMKVNALYEADGTMRPDAFVICPIASGGCGLKRNLGHIESYLKKVIATRLTDVGPRDTGQAPVAEMTRARLETELQTAQVKTDEVRTMFTNGLIESDDFVAMLRDLRDRMELLRTQIDMQKDAPIIGSEADLTRTWAGGSLEQRRKLLAELITGIVLLPVGRIGPKAVKAAVPATCIVGFRS